MLFPLRKLEPPFRFIRGDCDGDGRVGSGGLSGAIRLLDWIFAGGTAPPCLAACDFDRDGAVEGGTTDAIALLRFTFAGGPAPPPPFLRCGSPTATDEAVGCESPSCK